MTIFGSVGLRGTLFQVRDPLHVLLRIPQKMELAGAGKTVDENKMWLLDFCSRCVFGVLESLLFEFFCVPVFFAHGLAEVLLKPARRFS
jgi:hypothetical protein